MRQSHVQAIKHQGIILQPANPIDLVTYIDADFSGTWDPKDAADDPDTAGSRSGYLVFLANASPFLVIKTTNYHCTFNNQKRVDCNQVYTNNYLPH
jgi:hypothetical protein